MRKFKTFIDVSTEDRTSLGLRTPRLFELQLLEIAVGGRRALEKYWDEEGERFPISERVMCLEILREFEQFEKYGSMDTLVERARNQVVKMKGNKDLHHRALLVYRYWLNLSISRESLSQTRREESLSIRKCESKEYSRSSHVLNIDERLDLMIGIELPEIEDWETSNQPESITKKQEGEPSGSGSSCEVVSLFDDTMSCETLSIFERPIETEGFISPDGLGCQEKRSSEMSLYADGWEERDSMFSVQDSLNSPVPSPKYMTWNDDELKIEFEGDKQPKVRRSFPGKDFEKPIEWKVDNITYKAASISDLQKNHDIVIQGSFCKRGGRFYTWRNYYGFFLNTGIMLYFRKETFKKAADFRKSTPSIPKSKPFKLNIQGLYVNSKAAHWLLKFANEKKLNAWYETILKFSKSRNNIGLEQLRGSTSKVH